MLSSILIARKMKFSIKDFFSKCDQIRKKLRFLCIVSRKCYRTLESMEIKKTRNELRTKSKYQCVA